MKKRLKLIAGVLLASASTLSAQTVNVDVNLNVNHKLGKNTSFEREKFINIHSDVTTHYWYDDDLFTNNLINDFLNQYDVYMGRNTGTITWAANNVKEDVYRPGYCDTLDLARLGQANREKYASNTHWHAYEERNNLNLCTQLWPLYPDGEKATAKGWHFSGTDTKDEPWGTASGEFYAQYIKHFFGTGGITGQPKPPFLEIVNEPLWEKYEDIENAFRYHKTVAHQIRKLHPSMKIAGYCTAFPNLEENNFQRWENRWKKFMDIAGNDMDIWSIHLYDAPSIDDGTKKKLRRGSYVEATMDMMEHYSTIKFGYPKPFVISEFGASSHDYKGAWHPYNDYLQNVSCNAMTLQFMERCNNITQAMNYTMLKASWGTKSVNDVWSARLLRRENEPKSLTGKWIYSDRIQYYQLWANVKGKRIETKAHNLDIMTDAFVDGNKAYVVVNNLHNQPKAININLFEKNDLIVQNLMIKHFHLDNKKKIYDENVGKIDTINLTAGSIPEILLLDEYGTMVLEYTFSSEIAVDEAMLEDKYYATEYFKPISPKTPMSFQINNVLVPNRGEAVLRIGMGREHGTSLRPKVMINGTEVLVPADFRGDNQKDREVYFGVIEVEVPVDLLSKNNTIELTFPDGKGHISSLAMQVFNFKGNINRSATGPVTGISITPNKKWLPLNGKVQLVEQVYPTMATNQNVNWHSSDESIAVVSPTGMVTAVGKPGEVTITAVTEEGSYSDECVLNMKVADPGFFSIDSKLKYKNTEYNVGDKIEVVLDYYAGTEATVQKANGGVRVRLRKLNANWQVLKDWSFSDSTTIGTNKGTAHVMVDLKGLKPTAELRRGEFYFLLPDFSSSNGEKFSINGLSHIQIVGPPTGFDEKQISDIKVYPNPVKDHLTVKANGELPKKCRVKIYNMKGNIMLKQLVRNSNFNLNVSSLVNGMYVLKIEGTSICLPFIVSK